MSEVFQYVRPLHAGPNYGGSYYSNYAPLYDIYSENVRCGWGGADTGKGVETLPVNAGDTITFYPTQLTDGNERPESIYHEGPGQAYLSKVDDGDLENNRGDGDWFKIGTHGPLNDTHWKLYYKKSVSDTNMSQELSLMYFLDGLQYPQDNTTRKISAASGACVLLQLLLQFDAVLCVVCTY